MRKLVSTLVVQMGVIVILIAVILPQLTATVAEVASQLPDYINSVVQWLRDFLSGFGITVDALEDFSVDWEQVFSDLTTYLKEGSANVQEAASSAGSNSSRATVSVVPCGIWGMTITPVCQNS